MLQIATFSRMLSRRLRFFKCCSNGFIKCVIDLRYDTL